MAISLRESKLRPPDPPRHEVPRPRVVDAVSRALDARVVVVHASAGFGKSVALGRWARERGGDVRWITVDSADNDPERFWGSMLGTESLAEAAGSAGRRAPLPPDRFTDRVLDALDRRTTVIDRFDLLTDPLVLSSLDDVVSRAPAGVRFVLIGRRAPALPALARLRVDDEVARLDEDTLRFDAAETHALLTELGVEPDPLEIDALLHRTEGWAVGLELAALAARDARPSARTGSVFEHFGGTSPDVARYFDAEVLHDLSDAEREFLRVTAVADRVNASLACALSGRDDAGAVLRDLERDGRFVRRLPDDESSYRLHPLLADMMRAELEAQDRTAFREAHRTAASWCEHAGDDDGALRHAFVAGDVSAAWSRFSGGMINELYAGNRGRVTEWADLLGGLTDVDLRHAPAIALTQVLAGRWEAAEELLARARASDDPRLENPRYAAWTTYVEYIVAFAWGDVLTAARLGTEAHRMLDAAAPGEWDRVRAPLVRIALLSLLGRTDRARVVHDDYKDRFPNRLPGDDATLDARLAEIELAEGNLTEAMRLATRSRARMDMVGGEVGFEVQYVMGTVLAHRNELTEAEELLADAIVRADTGSFTHASVLTRLSMAATLHAMGEQLRAHSLVAEARTRVTRRARVLAQRCDTFDALLAMGEGDYEGAARKLQRVPETARSRLLAHVQARAGQHAAALQTLSRAPSHTLRDRIETAVIRAECAVTEQEQDLALGHALELAQPHGYQRMFVREASWIREPLTRLVGVWPTSYPADLLGAIAAAPPAPRPLVGGTGLTARELEVLRYLGSPLSMSEIAQALFVSRNTVKSHVRSIYGKLGVSSRQAAVAAQHREHHDTTLA